MTEEDWDFKAHSMEADWLREGWKGDDQTT